MSYGYFVETRGKKLLTGLFGQYVPPELVQEMSASPESYDLNAESKELTVLLVMLEVLPVFRKFFHQKI